MASQGSGPARAATSEHDAPARDASDGPDAPAHDAPAHDAQPRRQRRRDVGLLRARAEAVAHLGSWHLDLLSGEISWSEEMFRIFGRDPRSAPPDRDAIAEAVHPDDRPAFDAAVAASLERPASGSVEYRIVRPDGAVRWLHGEGEAELDGPGRPVGLVGFVQDITPRKDAEAASMRLQAEHAASALMTTAALEAADEMIATYRPLVDASGRLLDVEIVFVNGAGRRHWLGVASLDDVKGRRLLDCQPALKPLVDGLYRTAVESQIPFKGHVELVTADGPRTYDLALTPFADGLLHVARDVTEEHRAVEALRKSEDRLRRIQEGIAAIVVFEESQGDPIVVTLPVRDILGYEPASITEYAAWDALIHPDDLAACRAAWGAGAASWEVEYRMRRADGRWVWVSDRGRVLPHADGRPAGRFGVVVDVTPHHEAAEALRASEAQFRRMVEGIDAVVAYQEHDGQPAILSPQVERILGYRAEEVAAFASWDEIIHPDDLPACKAGWDPDAAGWSLEYRARRADGEWIWVADRGRRLRDEAGRSDGMFGVIVDVTDRRRAEEDARTANERERRFFESNIVGTVVAQVDGAVLEANDYWLRLTGLTRADLARGAVNWRAQTTAESLAADDRAIAEMREHGTSAPYEKAYVDREGREVPVLEVCTLLPGPDGLMASFVLDISELREANAERARLALAIDQTSESVIVTDLEGTITYVNPAFERVSGYARGEVIGGNPRILKSGRHAPDVYRGMWERLAAGEAWRGELTNRRKDGSIFTEVVSINPILDAAGAATGYVAVKRDVTSELELEAKLRQSQRLEAVGQLAGGIAHDFNNMLAAIRGYGEFVQGSLEPGTDTRADIDELLVSVDRAAGLTRQLLAFSRRSVLAPKVLVPSGVIDGLAPMLRRLLGEQVRLATTHEAGLGSVQVDPGQLEQVIVNLAVNARDAMPDGGDLTIATANVPPDPVEDGGLGWVRIAVSDTGPGIDGSVLPRVFEPFFTTKETGKGSGMGLATVYGIVRQSGGSIAVASEAGRGATFTIDLPRVDGGRALPGHVADAPAPAPGGTGTILLVEDETPVRKVAARMARSLGYRVLEAASGREALEIAGANAIDLLLTDVRMPGMQGPEVARTLRERTPTLPVLFMSGYYEASEVVPGAAGDTPLAKPFDLRTLAERIRAALEAERS